MHLDVADLRDFYASPLGGVTRRILSHKLRARWPRVHGEIIAALGFAPPYLGVYRGEASHVLALMPETQGALVWPSQSAVLSALVEGEQLPLRDNALDRLMIIHGLEVTERASVFLREAWRVLKPEGRLLITVPNRRGLWAHVETTPFGQGQPYSRSQLEALLRQSLVFADRLQHSASRPALRPPLPRAVGHGLGAFGVEAVACVGRRARCRGTKRDGGASRRQSSPRSSPRAPRPGHGPPRTIMIVLQV